MNDPRNRSLVLAAALGVLMAALTGCSLLQPASDASAAKSLGPYPLGVSIQQERYTATLAEVSVNGTRTIALSQRVSSDPRAMPDTATAAAQRATAVKPFVVSAGLAARPTARVGYRFVDAVVALKAQSATDAVELQRGVITSATVLAGDRRHPLGDRSAGLAAGTLTVYETMEFELPVTAESAILQLGLRDTTETVSFRLW